MDKKPLKRGKASPAVDKTSPAVDWVESGVDMPPEMDYIPDSLTEETFSRLLKGWDYGE